MNSETGPPANERQNDFCLEELKTYDNVVVCTNSNIIIVAQSIALPSLLYLVGAAVGWRVLRAVLVY